jgi:hypothetical protein
MSAPLAVIRPSEWEFPLFLHVLGAILLMGALMVTATALVTAWRREDRVAARALTRFGLWSLLVGVVPAFILMRVAAEWIASKENFGEDDDPAWLGVGYITADFGAALILVSIVLSIIGLRRLRGEADRSVLGRIVGVIALLLLVAYAVAVWAMTGKPD